MKILAIIGSPRKKSNTTTLLNEFIAGAESEGAEVTTITPHRMKIGPCLACDGCYKTGRCIVKDEFQAQYEAVLASDALVLATSIYFGAMTAQVKAFIDRFQCFWARRDIVKDPLPPGPAGKPRKGVLISVGGIDKPIMFAGARTTFDFVMRSLDGEFWAELNYGGYDERDAIRENPEALARARELGRRLALGLAAE